MPPGIIHEELRKKGRLISYPLSILIPVVLLPIQMKGMGEIIVGIGIFLGYEFIGKYMTPDWDLHGVTNDESRMITQIPILGHFLFGVSSTYGSFFYRHHRSFWTHFPFISTAIRYLFLFWWIFYQVYQSEKDLAWLIFLFIGLFIGTSLSDTVHWLADISGYWKGE